MFKKKTGASDKGGTNLVKTQNHEEIIQSVQELSNKTQKHKPLTTVTETGKFFGLGTHKVTGKELNITLSQIDDEMIRSKEFDAAVLDHITALYQALDALDAEHICGIMTAANVAKAADDKANINGQNIEKLVTLFTNNPQYIAQKNELKKTIEVMKNKIKTACYIAGGSIALAVIAFLLGICDVF